MKEPLKSTFLEYCTPENVPMRKRFKKNTLGEDKDPQLFPKPLKNPSRTFLFKSVQLSISSWQKGPSRKPLIIQQTFKEPFLREHSWMFINENVIQVEDT